MSLDAKNGRDFKSPGKRIWSETRMSITMRPHTVRSLNRSKYHLINSTFNQTIDGKPHVNNDRES
jgi:hypothetical protein